MTERTAIYPPDNYLDGVEWGELQREKPVISQIRHSHYGISLVELTFEGRPYQIALYTESLELDEAERVCRNVPEWWDESKDWTYLYDIEGEVLWQNH